MQTSIEWLVKKLNLEGYDHTIQQAKEMHEKEITDAVAYGNTFPEYRHDIDEIGEVYYKWIYLKTEEDKQNLINLNLKK